MYSITLKSILYEVQPVKGFIYESVRFSTVWPQTIEVAVVPRRRCAPRCSGCVYQIDQGLTRLLWVGHDRTEAALLSGLNSLGTEVCAGIRFVCADLWAPYLAAVRQRLKALHVLDRFHIRRQLNQAGDEVRRQEARALAQAGLIPRLKQLRWALLKNRRNWTISEHRRMLELEHSGLASLRAFWLVAAFDHFWNYVSPTWAGKFLDGWCRKVRRSRLKPLKTVAATLAEHREILLNYFRAKKAISGGVIEGLNNKVKVTFRKSCGFRTDKAREIALFHVLGKLPEPEIIHGFF